MNKLVSSSFLESKMERFNTCWWRPFESFTMWPLELLSPKPERQGWQRLHRAWSRESQREAMCLTGPTETSLLSKAASHILSGWRKSVNLPLNLAVKRETMLGKSHLPCAWHGVGLSEEYAQPPSCPREKNVLLRSSEWAKAVGRYFSFSFSGLQEGVLWPASPSHVNGDWQIPPLFPPSRDMPQGGRQNRATVFSLREPWHKQGMKARLVPPFVE